MRLYSQKDVDRKALKRARIAVLGYGSQGRAHALNLKDSGCDVVVGVRRGGPSWKKARRDGLETAEPADAVQGAELETTFAEETETDLFGEQAVLCGGATELVVKGFETLVEAGYQPEVAYYECLHELKLIVDLLHEGGLAKMHQFISETAKYGDLTRGPRIVNERVKNEMRKVLKEVQSGKFARQWIRENAAGRANYQRLLDEDVDRQIEKVGAALRARCRGRASAAWRAAISRTSSSPRARSLRRPGTASTCSSPRAPFTASTSSTWLRTRSCASPRRASDAHASSATTWSSPPRTPRAPSSSSSPR